VQKWLSRFRDNRPYIADCALGIGAGAVLVVLLDSTLPKAALAIGLGNAEDVCAVVLVVCLVIWVTCRDPRH
jgi:hypothetical protein